MDGPTGPARAGGVGWRCVESTIAKMLLRTYARPASLFMRSIAPTVQPVRTVTSLSKTMYTAKAESSGGGRNGVAKLREEGPLKFQLALPKSLGGSGEGQNPEQFFGKLMA